MTTSRRVNRQYISYNSLIKKTRDKIEECVTKGELQEELEYYESVLYFLLRYTPPVELTLKELKYHKKRLEEVRSSIDLSIEKLEYTYKDKIKKLK